MSHEGLRKRPLLVFDKEGSWHIDGVEVSHEKIYLLLSSSLRKNAATGAYEVRIDQEVAPVFVEAAPFVVKTIERLETTNGEASFQAILNDGSKHLLSLHSLCIGPDNSLYCETKGHLARFKRAPFFELAKYIEEEYIDDKEVGADTESRYCIKSGTTKHYIKFS